MSKPDKYQKKLLPQYGSRIQVMRGRAQQTRKGELPKDLIKNRWGRIVNKNAHLAAFRKMKKYSNDVDGTVVLFGKTRKLPPNPHAPKTRKGMPVTRPKETRASPNFTPME